MEPEKTVQVEEAACDGVLGKTEESPYDVGVIDGLEGVKDEEQAPAAVEIEGVAKAESKDDEVAAVNEVKNYGTNSNEGNGNSNSSMKSEDQYLGRETMDKPMGIVPDNNETDDIQDKADDVKSDIKTNDIADEEGNSDPREFEAKKSRRLPLRRTRESTAAVSETTKVTQDKWDEKYSQLCEYKRKFGNCNVPLEYMVPESSNNQAPDAGEGTSGTCPSLGQWVARQRAKSKNPRAWISKERKEQLEAIGFFDTDVLPGDNAKEMIADGETKQVAKSRSRTLPTREKSSRKRKLPLMYKDSTSGDEIEVDEGDDEVIKSDPGDASDAASAEEQETQEKPSPRKRAKPSRTRATGAWSPEEHELFKTVCFQHGWGNWKKIAEYLPSRTRLQVKSHAQKILKNKPQLQLWLASGGLKGEEGDYISRKNSKKVKKRGEGPSKQSENGSCTIDTSQSLCSDLPPHDNPEEKEDKKWEIRYAELQSYIEINKHCDVPLDNTLGIWLNEQKRLLKANKLPHEKRARLDKLGVRKRSDESWNHQFERLKEFKEIHNHCNVPLRYKEDPKLGRWVIKQRACFGKQVLSADRMALLEGLGFEFTRKNEGLVVLSRAGGQSAGGGEEKDNRQENLEQDDEKDMTIPKIPTWSADGKKEPSYNDDNGVKKQDTGGSKSIVSNHNPLDNNGGALEGLNEQTDTAKSKAYESILSDHLEDDNGEWKSMKSPQLLNQTMKGQNDGALYYSSSSKFPKKKNEWSDYEHVAFEQGCIRFGWGRWKEMKDMIPTRTRLQIKSHAQKFLQLNGKKKLQLDELHGQYVKNRSSDIIVQHSYDLAKEKAAKKGKNGLKKKVKKKVSTMKTLPTQSNKLGTNATKQKASDDKEETKFLKEADDGGHGVTKEHTDENMEKSESVDREVAPALDIGRQEVALPVARVSPEATSSSVLIAAQNTDTRDTQSNPVQVLERERDLIEEQLYLLKAKQLAIKRMVQSLETQLHDADNKILELKQKEACRCRSSVHGLQPNVNLQKSVAEQDETKISRPITRNHEANPRDHIIPEASRAQFPAYSGNMRRPSAVPDQVNFHEATQKEGVANLPRASFLISNSTVQNLAVGTNQANIHHDEVVPPPQMSRVLMTNGNLQNPVAKLPEARLHEMKPRENVSPPPRVNNVPMPMAGVHQKYFQEERSREMNGKQVTSNRAKACDLVPNESSQMSMKGMDQPKLPRVNSQSIESKPKDNTSNQPSTNSQKNNVNDQNSVLGLNLLCSVAINENNNS